jgi:hypothetical protein
MLTLLCVDSNIQRLNQLCADLAPLNDRLVIIRANNLQQAQRYKMMNMCFVDVIG